MSDMKCLIKCPMCGEVLQKYGEIDPDAGTSIVLGANCPKCGIGNSDIKLWQELIRTRKELDIALCSLQDIAESNGDFITGSSTTLDVHEYAAMMLDKIKTALEQKDVK